MEIMSFDGLHIDAGRFLNEFMVDSLVLVAISMTLSTSIEKKKIYSRAKWQKSKTNEPKKRKNENAQHRAHQMIFQRPPINTRTEHKCDK